MSVSRPRSAAVVACTRRRSSTNAPQRTGAEQRRVAMSAPVKRRRPFARQPREPDRTTGALTSGHARCVGTTPRSQPPAFDDRTPAARPGRARSSMAPPGHEVLASASVRLHCRQRRAAPRRTRRKCAGEAQRQVAMSRPGSPTAYATGVFAPAFLLHCAIRATD